MTIKIYTVRKGTEFKGVKIRLCYLTKRRKSREETK